MQVARSSLECRLYIELHPCDCGATASDLHHRMVMRDNRLTALYEATCAQCQNPIEYVFALADEIVAAEKFGGADPSTIIDPGQFMRESDRLAQSVVLSRPDRTQDARNLYSMARAIACLEEVMKWLPEPLEMVPADAFFTEQGKQFAAREPKRFRRSRLRALLAAYQEKLFDLRALESES
jgi:hypothetical protein